MLPAYSLINFKDMKLKLDKNELFLKYVLVPSINSGVNYTLQWISVYKVSVALFPLPGMIGKEELGSE